MAKKPAQDKRKAKVIQVPLRFLKGSGSGYVSDPHYALGAESRYPTPPEYLVGGDEIRDVPELAIPPEDQKRITDAANEADKSRQSAAEYAALQEELTETENLLARHEETAKRRGVNITSDVRVIRRRLEVLNEKLGLQKAA